MSTNEISLIGAGGHAAVVVDALQVARPAARIRIFDHDPDRVGESVLECEILPWQGWDAIDDLVHVAIGDNANRRSIAQEAGQSGKRLVSIVHPQATVASSAAIGDGVFIAAGSVVAPRAMVEIGAIVNHNAIVDHDVAIGSYSHIAPGVVLGGAVVVGNSVLIGAGATVLPKRQIGDAATVGAGAVVTRHVPVKSLVVGLPAREADVD